MEILLGDSTVERRIGPSVKTILSYIWSRP
jgi:hypothetical protein